MSPLLDWYMYLFFLPEAFYNIEHISIDCGFLNMTPVTQEIRKQLTNRTSWNFLKSYGKWNYQSHGEAAHRGWKSLLATYERDSCIA